MRNNPTPKQTNNVNALPANGLRQREWPEIKVAINADKGPIKTPDPTTAESSKNKFTLV